MVVKYDVYAAEAAYWQDRPNVVDSFGIRLYNILDEGRGSAFLAVGHHMLHPLLAGYHGNLEGKASVARLTASRVALSRMVHFGGLDDQPVVDTETALPSTLEGSLLERHIDLYATHGAFAAHVVLPDETTGIRQIDDMLPVSEATMATATTADPSIRWYRHDGAGIYVWRFAPGQLTDRLSSRLIEQFDGPAIDRSEYGRMTLMPFLQRSKWLELNNGYDLNSPDD